MNIIDIILLTFSAIILIEGMLLSIFAKSIAKNIKKMFKNHKNVLGIGLIEIILALLIMFIIAL